MNTDLYTELSAVSDADLKKLARLFEPFNDVVIVAVDDAEKVTTGGILLPTESTNNMHPQSGTVVAFGPGARSPLSGDRVPLSVSQGDRVVFGAYAGGDLTYGDLKLKTMREPDILARISDDDAVQPEAVRVHRKKAAKTAKKKAQKKAAKRKTKKG